MQFRPYQKRALNIEYAFQPFMRDSKCRPIFYLFTYLLHIQNYDTFK